MIENLRRTNAETFQLPDFMREFADRLRAIERFSDSEVEDNVLDHTVSAVIIARSIEAGQDVEDTLWVHDVAEIVIGDNPVLTGKKPTIEEEINAIRELITDPQKQKLAINFVHSEAYLTGKGDYKLATPQGILASVIDRIEGNVYFHTWMASVGKQSPRHNQYTIRQRADFHNKLNSLWPRDEFYIPKAKMLIDAQFGYYHKIYGGTKWEFPK